MRPSIRFEQHLFLHIFAYIYKVWKCKTWYMLISFVMKSNKIISMWIVFHSRKKVGVTQFQYVSLHTILKINKFPKWYICLFVQSFYLCTSRVHPVVRVQRPCWDPPSAAWRWRWRQRGGLYTWLYKTCPRVHSPSLPHRGGHNPNW